MVIYISDSSPIDDVSCCLVSVYDIFFYDSIVVGLLVLFLLTYFVMDHWMHECGNIIGSERSSLASSALGGSRTYSLLVSHFSALFFTTLSTLSRKLFFLLCFSVFACLWGTIELLPVSFFSRVC